ncbi:MAG: element excision factor XisH family protein, partial [Chloroflexota bacterium]
AIHNNVKNALENDGWNITADPYRIRYKDALLEADMKAEKLILATRENHSVIIEVKSFLSQSFIHEFIQACGQYQAYAFLLDKSDQAEKVYMAVSLDVYESEFSRESIQVLRDHFKVHLLIIDIIQEAIVEWIEYKE